MILNNKILAGLILLTLAGVSFSAQAARVEHDPQVGFPGLLSVENLATISVTGFNLAELDQQDLKRAQDGEPFRYAVPHEVSLSPENSGTWESLDNGGRMWRLRLDCQDARSVSLGFEKFQIPAGATLRIYDAKGTGAALVFDNQDVKDHGQLWTPVLLTDDVVVEFVLPGWVTPDWTVNLTTVGWGYRYFGELPGDKAGDCNIDVVCPEGDDWRDEIASVGVYTVSGTWKCTGVMINNTAQDERPLFLTANHCAVDDEAASEVVIYWNYQSVNCGDLSGGSLDQFSLGTIWLASYPGSDFTLLELEDDPDPDFEVNFAGWDRSNQVPPSAVTIHHPSTDEKSISFEDDPLTITTYLNQAVPGNSTHFRVEDWDLGTTEPGSSGAPLFNPEKLIVGQLHGGYAACGNDLADWYGRMYTSWTGGGTDTSRLSNWLDPLNLGVTSLHLLVGGGPVIPPPPPTATNANITILALAPNPFQDFIEITVEMERPAQAQAMVYDMAGRLMVDLGGRLLVEGENDFAWDGFDAGGRRVPAGVYVLVMTSEGKTSQRRFVRLN